MRLRPVVERIWFRRAYSAFETQWAYFDIVRAVYPERLGEFFPRLGAWFIRLDPEAEYPYFDKTNQLNIPVRQKSDDEVQVGSGKNLYWGPFATKKSAGEFLEILQDLFDLCRCPQFLAQAPCASGCSYAQMGRCAAVCNGTVSTERYRRIINEAIDFLNRPMEESRGAWERHMKASAADLQFEKAQLLKNKIALVQKLSADAFSWVVPLARFYVLVFQGGPRVKVAGRRGLAPTISPFIITAGRISQIEPFPLSEAGSGVQSTLDHLHLKQMQSSPPEESILGWAANFLYRKSGARGLYLPADENLRAEDLAGKIEEHFAD
ncbi:MAG: hypothetical protein AMJ79_03630 [Phycisphaerae bacterium SM23_30]|nr:MAG: hypothetical protein AMJ79_03630 [Phycisphaerae bacterium SM23_30]